jgi:uncharacterized FlgJ-related protein
MYTINDELQLIDEPDYKWPFWILLIIFMAFMAYVYNKAPELRIEYIDKTDTIILEKKPMPLTDSAITHELTKLGCVLPNVALAQFKVETGHFTSAICKENKNIAGIRNSASPLSIGKNRGHNVYKTYRDCLKDYVRIQNKYLKAIDGKYAETKGYVEYLKKVK